MLQSQVSLTRVTVALGSLGCAMASSSSAPLDAPNRPACRDLTRAHEIAVVSTVCGEDVGGIPTVSAVELLEGRVPGARMVRLAGGGTALRLWGPSTIHGDNEPLYVLDGMPVHVSPGRGLDWLNPGDILRIEVLKDVSATALYGVRGANGVVLITTRRGHTHPD